MASNSQKMATFLFVAVTLLSSYVAANRHYGVIYVDLGDGRGPAAIRRAYDVSDLEGKALSRKVNEQLIGEAHILKLESKIGLELGQFVTDFNGKKMLACSIYERVEMIFQSEGIASHGEVPEMAVEGPCRNSGEKLMWMQPIWIPVADLLARPTTTAAVDFFDEEPVSLRFENVGDQWPRQWILNKVILHDEQRPDQNLIVDRNSIRAANPKSLLLEF